MEEEKAAAYYDELTRKGGGAARFKQGLGFSTAGTTSSNHNDAVPSRGSALPSSSSSFLSSFVRASSPSSKSSELQKQAQIESIQNKLKKKPISSSSSSSRVSDDHRSRGRETDKHSSRRRRSRSRSRSRSRDGDERSRNRRRHRSSSRDRDRDRDRKEDRDRYMDRRKRSRSVSPRRRRSEKRRDDDRKARKEKTGGIDHAKLIEGYDTMSPAERVKAKMKLQLSATAKLDEANGMGSGWERFKFDKDAPLDDEEIEAVEDDGDLVKHIGQTFRFSAVEARREEKIKATHDEAIFGTSSLAPPVDTDSEAEGNDHARESPETAPAASLISDQVRSLQQGSWRDRARRA